MSDSDEQLSLEDFDITIKTLTGMASTFPPPVSLSVCRSVCAVMASAAAPESAQPAIANALKVFRVLAEEFGKTAEPAQPPGWKAIVAWWSKTLCEALFPPVALAVIEGHLRTLGEKAATSDDEAERSIGRYAVAVADQVLVPTAQRLFEANPG